MKPIENENLENLSKIAELRLIEKKRELAIEQIMQLLERIGNLQNEVQSTEKKLNNQRTELERMRNKLDILRKGDWNAIPEIEVKNNKIEDKKEN